MRQTCKRLSLQKCTLDEDNPVGVLEPHLPPICSLTESGSLHECPCCLQTGTYNVNGRMPVNNMDLKPWLGGAVNNVDIIAVAFQEIVPLNAQNVVIGETHSRLQSPFKFCCRS